MKQVDRRHAVLGTLGTLVAPAGVGSASIRSGGAQPSMEQVLDQFRAGSSRFPFAIVTDHPSVQAAIDSLPTGGIVFFPQLGSPYVVPPLEVNAPGIFLVGDAGGEQRPELVWEVLGEGTAGIRVTQAGFSMHNLRLSGPTPGQFVQNENLVEVPSDSFSARDRAVGITVTQCDFRNAGGHGLFVHYADQVRVSDCHFTTLGHSGASFRSCNNGYFMRNRIRSIGPGNSLGNAYGVSLSHSSGGWPEAEPDRPFCSDWWVTENVVEDIPWNGIDGHGGWRVRISDNLVRNTRFGISSAQSSGDAIEYAAGPNWIESNQIICDIGNEYRNQGYGINVSGGTARRSLGTIVRNNRLDAKGLKGDARMGAILIGSCQTSIVEGNYIENIGTAGISIRGSSVTSGFSTGRVKISDNLFGDKSNDEAGRPLFAFLASQNSDRAFFLSNNHLYGTTRPLSGLIDRVPGVTTPAFSRSNYSDALGVLPDEDG